MTALQVSEYLVHETEWVPLDMFADSMDYLDGMVRTLPDYDLFRVSKNYSRHRSIGFTIDA